MIYSPLVLKILVSAFSANVALLVIATFIAVHSAGNRHNLRNATLCVVGTFFGSFVLLSMR